MDVEEGSSYVSPFSLDHAKPPLDKLELCERGGVSRSKPNPFSGSQVNPPLPVGAPNLCISSSYMRSCSAWAMAQSLASSCSAVVRKPSCSCWLTNLPAFALPLAHPSVMLFRRDAASAMTLRMSMPRCTGRAPPRRCPPSLALTLELVVRLRFSAAILA